MAFLDAGALGAFPLTAFSVVCQLVESDDVPLPELACLVDLVRNVLAVPSAQPLVLDLAFAQRMLSRICNEMEEHLCRDGAEADVQNEASVIGDEQDSMSPHSVRNRGGSSLNIAAAQPDETCGVSESEEEADEDAEEIYGAHVGSALMTLRSNTDTIVEIDPPGPVALRA